MTGYKMCRHPDINIYPMFVETKKPFIMGEWNFAEEGERNALGKVKSTLGGLCYRPGLHLSVAPYAPHIGKKVNGKIKYMHDDTVWVECEIADEIDYTPIARMNGMRNGKFNSNAAYLKYIPENGFYWFNTNPNAMIDWLITSAIKPLRILNDAETAIICLEMGITNPILHQN